MSQFGVPFTLIGPSGARAVFNDDTDPDYVGLLSNVSGLDSAEVRENFSDRVEGDGAEHGNFWYGRRPVILEGMIRHTSAADRNAKEQKLLVASDAMRGDAVLAWTPDETTPIARRVVLRRQQPVRVTGAWNKSFQVPMISANSLIESNQARAHALVSAGVTNINAPLFRAALREETGFTDTGSAGATITPSGGVVAGGAIGPFGEAGGATAFDGVNDVLNTNYAGWPTSGIRAYSFFVNRYNSVADMTVLSGNGATYSLIQLEDLTHDIRFYLAGTSYGPMAQVPPREWHHVVVIFHDPANLVQGYIDGRFAFQYTVTQSHDAGNTTMHIGAWASGAANPLKGALSQVCVHPNFTAGEIRALASVGPGPTAHPSGVFTTGFPTTLTNRGTANVPVKLRLWDDWNVGGGGKIQLDNVTTNQRIQINTSITSAGYLELDTLRRTVRFVSDTGGTVTNNAGQVDFPETSWWHLAPGDNIIYLTSGSLASSAVFSAEWRDGWVGV